MVKSTIISRPGRNVLIVVRLFQHCSTLHRRISDTVSTLHWHNFDVDVMVFQRCVPSWRRKFATYLHEERKDKY